MKNLDTHYPSIEDLRRLARRRIPNFAFEYLDSGTGQDRTLSLNRRSLDQIRFTPEILHGEPVDDLACTVMGETYSLPLGIAPIGMSGLIWPAAERRLACAAARHTIPFCLSTVTVAPPEDIGPVTGKLGWFQLYVPSSSRVCRDILDRVEKAGFSKLVVTVDVPAESRRERQRRAGMGYPPRLSPRMMLAIATRPTWALAMLMEGVPRMKLAESYLEKGANRSDQFMHAGRLIRGYPDWDVIREIRQLWHHDLIIKGVQRPEDAVRLREAGADGLWVSNHGGRQFDAGPSSISGLVRIRKEIGSDFPVLFDSGIMGGLDIMRALACGADMVFMGKGFHYAVAALGERGIDHLLHIVAADMKSNMAQIGAYTFADLAQRLDHTSLDRLA